MGGIEPQSLFRTIEETHSQDRIVPRSFVSHTADTRREEANFGHRQQQESLETFLDPGAAALQFGVLLQDLELAVGAAHQSPF